MAEPEERAPEFVVSVKPDEALNTNENAAIADQSALVKVPLERTQFILVFIGLILGIMMAALDQTIVSTALKTVVQDFGHQDLVPWIGSAYLMTAAPFGTLYGKFADLFGRKWIFVFALVVFEIGSFLCGIAPNMETLIVGRAVAGVGGGGIFSCVLIIISDIVSIQDRGKFMGIIGACFGLSSVIGPLVGGAFSDYVSWRWCFYVNLPLGAITVTTVIVFLNFPSPPGTFMEKFRRIDFLGTAVLFCAITSIVTPLQLGGSIWAWKSAQVIVMFILFPIFTALFVYIEQKVAAEPIIPAAMFVNQSIPALLVVAFCTGASFFSAVYYVSLFFQVVNGDSATSAGVKTIPLVFGVVLMSIASGVVVSKTGNYKMFYYNSAVFMTAGAVLISYLDKNSVLVQKIFYLFIFGIGAGSAIQTRVLGIQASVPVQFIAIATAVSQTCMTLGGAFGVSVSGTIFNNVITSDVNNYANLDSAIASLTAHNIPADPTEVLALQGILIAKNGTIVQNSDAAISDLVNLFNGAYKIAYLTLLMYPIGILVSTFFITQFGVRSKPSAGRSGGN